MTTKYINPDDLPHRSEAVVHNGIAYLSGVIPTDTTGDITDQAKQVLAGIDQRLAEVGSSKDRLLSVTIWMKDVNRDVEAFNAVWNQWVVPGRLPARSCIEATIQRNSLLEIAVVAAV